MSCFVYILKSESADRYYIGCSSNPTRRLEFHNTKKKGFTSRYRPWKIVFEKEYSSKKEALKIEKKIKSWKSRKMSERVINREIEI